MLQQSGFALCLAVLVLSGSMNAATGKDKRVVSSPSTVLFTADSGSDLDPYLTTRQIQYSGGESWLTFRGDPQRTGRSVYPGPSVPASKWTYDLESLAYASPALNENGTVYVASADSVHAVTASGRRLWATAVDGTVISSPALSGRTVYVGATDGQLYALSADDGSLRWTFDTGDEIWASPAIGSDGIVYIGSFDGNVYAVDGETGQRLWAFATRDRVLSSVAIDLEGLLYVGSTDGSLYAIRPDGSLAWEFATGGEVVSSPAVGEDGTVYVGSADERLYAVHPDGRMRWSYQAGGAVVSSPAISSRGIVYVASYDGRLHAVGPNGSSIWQPVQMDGQIISSPTIDREGVVVIGSLGGTLYGVDGDDGATQWTHHVEGSIWSSPTLGPGRVVYVSAYDSLALTGALHAVGSTGVEVSAISETGIDEPVTIDVTLMDGIPSASGLLFFRRAGEHTYEPPISFQQQGGSTYSAVIPGEFSTLRGVEYYVRFEGPEEVFTYPIFEPEARPAFHPVRIAAYTPDLAMRPRVFQMVSVPLHLDDPAVGRVLDEYGTPASTEWRLFSWENGAYQEYPRIRESFKPGRAFFLVTKDGEGFAVENGTSVSTAAPYRITLQPGLTQIGNPYAFPVAWADVSRNEEAVQIIAYFDSETNEMVQDPARLQVLEPWQGYFVRNRSTEPAMITFPTQEAGSNAPGLNQTAFRNAEPPVLFNVQAHVIGTKLQDTQNWVGLSAHALEGEDALDIEEAPPIGDFVRLSIVDEGRRYAASYKPPGPQGRAWEAELMASDPGMAGRTVELRYAASTTLPPELNLYVIDLHSRSMLPASSGRVQVTLPDDGEPLRLRFVIGTHAFASDPSNAFGTPDKFEVEQNYPNPFHSGTTIRYYLSADAPVTITVFDLLGRTVATLVDEVQGTGWQEVAWDGRSGGARLASGMYFYRVTAGSNSTTRTMLLVE